PRRLRGDARGRPAPHQEPPSGGERDAHRRALVQSLLEVSARLLRGAPRGEPLDSPAVRALRSHDARRARHADSRQRLGTGWPLARTAGADEGTRTPTVLPPLGPEPSASTNSATSARGANSRAIGHALQ